MTAQTEARTVDDRLPIAATDNREVDEIDVTGWGAYKGHAIPVAVGRFIAEKISLYHAHRLSSALAAKDAELAALKKEASKFAKWVQDYSNDGHTARAARSFLDKWEGRDG